MEAARWLARKWVPTFFFCFTKEESFGYLRQLKGAEEDGFIKKDLLKEVPK